jgi:hypothetical protein
LKFSNINDFLSLFAVKISPQTVANTTNALISRTYQSASNCPYPPALIAPIGTAGRFEDLFYGLLGPAGMPQEAVDKLRAAIEPYCSNPQPPIAFMHSVLNHSIWPKEISRLRRGRRRGSGFARSGLRLQRGEHPVIVFDKDGKFLNAWGEGVFKSAHGIFIDREDSIYLTDDADHTVRVLTTGGEASRR